MLNSSQFSKVVTREDTGTLRKHCRDLFSPYLTIGIVLTVLQPLVSCQIWLFNFARWGRNIRKTFVNNNLRLFLWQVCGDQCTN